MGLAAAFRATGLNPMPIKQRTPSRSHRSIAHRAPRPLSFHFFTTPRQQGDLKRSIPKLIYGKIVLLEDRVQIMEAAQADEKQQGYLI